MIQPSELKVGDIVATGNGLEVVTKVEHLSDTKTMLWLESLGLLRSWRYRYVQYLKKIWGDLKSTWRGCGRDWDRCMEPEEEEDGE